MTITTTAAVAIAVANTYAAQIEAGTTVAPYFVIYGGTPPTSVRAALSGNTVLATVPYANDAFQDAVDDSANGYAKAVANAVADTPATTTGEASFYRAFNRDNVAVWQGSVTENNLGGDMELSSVSLVAGVNVVVQSSELRIVY